MAIALPSAERLPTGPRRDLVAAMHDLYDRAGQPATRDVARRTQRNTGYESVSHETVGAMLRGSAIPAWSKVQAMAVALAAMGVANVDVRAVLARLNGLWLEARKVDEISTPSTVPHRSASPSNQRPAVPVRPSPPPALVGDIPVRDSLFVGRDTLMNQLDQALGDRSFGAAVLHGPGGVGKSALAVEYLYQHADRYQVVWWVPANGSQAASTSLVTLAERLGLAWRSSARQAVAELIGELESGDRRYLLVFDDAADPDIRQLLPLAGGHVIVTTSDPEWIDWGLGPAVEVPVMHLAEAADLLRGHDPDISEEEVVAVFHAVGGLPSVLAQLVAVRQVTGSTWPSLLADLAEQRSAPDEAVVRIAVSRLAQTNPGAELLLPLFAWFAPGPVAVSLLRAERGADLEPRLARLLHNPVSFERALRDLTRYGLGRADSVRGQIEVLPSVRQWLPRLFDADEMSRARLAVQALLIAADPGSPDELPSWDKHRAIAPEVRPSGLIGSSLPAARRAIYHQIRYHYLTGEYENAVELAQSAVTNWQDRREDGNEGLILVAQREWANALRALGRYDGARRLTQEALARLRDDDEGARPSLTASHLVDLRIAGDYREAVALARQAADEYPPLRAELAHCLRLAGDFAAAAAADRESPASRGSLTRVNAIAEDLYGLGRLADALRILGESEPGDEVVDGRPIVLARRTAALARRGLGAVSEATVALSRLHRDSTTAFGRDDETALAVQVSYANTLRESGDGYGAHAIAVEAVDGYRRRLGLRNPLTLAAEVNLASTLRARGERRAARKADTVTHGALVDRVGQDHPFTVSAAVNLATDLALAGEVEAAHRLSERAYWSAREHRGAVHPDTLAAGANLALDHAAVGNDSPAEELRNLALHELEDTFGDEHPWVRAVREGTRIELSIEPPSL
ncbi:tetratricopeptide (TPR) repeat protein [Actinoplanes tereljensis]|uniref:ATP-binding protein n=1 Tax=Paractinoplanes tereljensis TaxID=571912 RepID=A0A919TS71_9ACTN|nr:FxSxx-COOH system tetratricopeptide repeat protein [Actinoplanes tereljensis]GIF19085.1 ATP-binding protein [Actinoplanes tereljensis]